ncbi:Ribonucleoside-diphosphate reductase 1 subunit alpha [Candidatus Kinetoplastibacterium sorsogonicusi]|uniref:Ribonucleoside-diphosphate reductase n=1 Tax=Candidatus Kinetoplastidibacterium kentomonadis TaxID=1576550 RepID=A0A3S7JAK0_9PROT|nr:ribonucleoside-diphosphate reductase subunit alpha [Candidatus Kinetoplastibacterium sorsogonicusi]AWD32694.1 Ribonucleoside-diphosphate reductase 1 subunit alpha [Candidatus Kinetoplastibacterium sorsogonicusi]
MKNNTLQHNLENFYFQEEYLNNLEKNFSSIKYNVIRRDGSLVNFAVNKISIAIKKSFIAIHGNSVENSSSIRKLIENLTYQTINSLLKNKPSGGNFHIEEIQDQVELSLMKSGEHDVARAYVIYREKRNQERKIKNNKEFNDIKIYINDNGNKKLLDIYALQSIINEATTDLNCSIDKSSILQETIKNLYDGVSIDEVLKSIILSSRSKIEKDPAYNQVTARLLMYKIRKEVLNQEYLQSQMQEKYEKYLPEFIKIGINSGLLSKDMETFNIEKLSKNIIAKRDLQFKYLGLQTLYDRYFLHIKGKRIELPQIFFMRVAMGLAIKEEDKDNKAIEFYNLLSSFDFMCSTPTLFNSGTIYSQLSSCYLTTVPDNLIGIYDSIKDNALLAKYAGGLGNDWTPVRALHSHIKGTNGESQGIVPFLKVVNDTALAVNQGGKRKGAVCTYLETWHLDIEEFLELRKNTGDERRRTHDMNTANWIPDLFMKRVMENKEWTLFSPSDCPDLHEKYGKSFEISYLKYEEKVNNGEIKLFKKIPAVSLWRKMLSMLFETGHPWITFKDPCNIRSPQQHNGVVHSSNLCTEITLNTNEEEIAVCNLGSINLASHIKVNDDGLFSLDIEKLKKTIKIGMRILDNVIDINFYAVEKAKKANKKHRPIGLGIMGFQDALHIMRIPYASTEAIKFADYSMEIIAYYTYFASSELAKERGSYETFNGSLWSKNMLPQDTIELLKNERENYIDIDNSSQIDWSSLRDHIKQYGMRNSNCLAIAPTATISNIIGVSASIEPTFQNLYVKSNLSGEFTIINEYLVYDLKKLNIWDEVMISDIKYFNGSLANIDRIPNELKILYATAFEIDSKWLVECASRRQKWIDQSQSLNIYISGVSGKKLDETYKLAWIKGLKTTYYLRTMSATYAEKSTGNGGELNSVSFSSKNINLLQSCKMKIGHNDIEECEVCQ